MGQTQDFPFDIEDLVSYTHLTVFTLRFTFAKCQPVFV